MVDHGILCNNLRSIGVSSTLWFESYLSNCSQCVDVGGSRSEFLPVVASLRGAYLALCFS